MPDELPAPLRRREILYGPNVPKEQLAAYAQAYEEAGRFGDALQFHVQAGDRQGLGRMKAKALELGDAFLLKAVAKAVPDLVGPGDWESLIARAEQLGKALYAEQARKALAGNLEALEPEEKRGQGKA